MRVLKATANAMGDYKGLHSPPSSPTSKKGKRKEDQFVTPPKPITPQLINIGSKRSRTDSSSGSKSVDGNKLEFGEGAGSSSVPLELDGLIGNMEQMVKMLRTVSGMKGLMADPVMACFVSAQTVIMACTAELISRRARPPEHQNKGSSTNTAAIANGAAHKRMKRSEHKN